MWESAVISKIRVIESSDFIYSLLICVYRSLSSRREVLNVQCGVDLPLSLPLLGFVCMWCPQSLTWQCLGALSRRLALLSPAPGISRGKRVSEEWVMELSIPWEQTWSQAAFDVKPSYRIIFHAGLESWLCCCSCFQVTLITLLWRRGCKTWWHK